MSNVSTSSTKKTLSWDEYLFLKDFYTLTRGDQWKRNDGWDFSDYHSKNPCQQKWFGLLINVEQCRILSIELPSNNLKGKLPQDFSNMTSVISIILYRNELSGSLPVLLNCTILSSLDISSNSLSGTIPETMFDRNSKVLNNVNLNFNRLFGTLPSWISSIRSLRYLKLTGNHLSGEFPKINYPLKQLLIESNHFHGNIQNIFNSYKHLRTFAADSNFFTGTVSAEMIQYVNRFSVAHNKLHGLLPTIASKSIVSLSYESNYFSGTIPLEHCWRQIVSLIFSDNILTGTIPPCLWNLPVNMRLHLDHNYLHGPVNILSFINVPYFSISIGSNFLTGPFPHSILRSPRLTDFQASENCFSKPFPHDFNCNNISGHLHFLDAHVLYSPQRCLKNNFKMLKYDHTFGGKFPQCLLELNHLKEIILSGNRFTGSLSNSLSIINSSLLTLNLSYNYLTGSIPSTLLQIGIRNLDLSYNKFIGIVNGIGQPKYIQNTSLPSSINLKHNRLSGAILTSEMNQYDRIEILQGNMFDCINNNMMPLNDLYSSRYICESLLLDYSSYSYCIVILFHVFLLLFVLVLYLFKVINIKTLFSLKWFKLVKETQKNYLLLTSMIQIRKYCLIMIFILLGYLLIFSFYCQRKLTNIKTWSFTDIYNKGSLSSITMIVTLFFSILIFSILTRNKNQKKEDTGRLQKDAISISSSNSPWKIGGIYALIFVFNASLSIYLNHLYIFFLNDQISDTKKDESFLVLSPNMEVMLFQIGLAFYNVVWNRYVLVFVLRYLRRMLKGLRLSGSREGWWEYEYGLILLLMNSVIGPWLSVMLRDESCFEKLLFSKSKFITTYQDHYLHHDLTNEGHLLNSNPVTSPMPFFYYYECGSKLLSTYLPIYFYQYSWLLLFTSVDFFLNNSSSLSRLSDTSRDIVQSLSSHLIVLYCFGIHYPFFGVIVVLQFFIEATILLTKMNHATTINLFGIKESEMVSIRNDKNLEEDVDEEAEDYHDSEEQALIIKKHRNRFITEVSDAVRTSLMSSELSYALDRNYFTASSLAIIVYTALLFHVIIVYDMIGDDGKTVFPVTWMPIVLSLFIVGGIVVRLLSVGWKCYIEFFAFPR